MKKSLTIYLIFLIFASVAAMAFVLADNNTTMTNSANQTSLNTTSTCPPGYVRCQGNSTTSYYCYYGNNCPQVIINNTATNSGNNTSQCPSGYILCPNTLNSYSASICYNGTTCPSIANYTKNREGAAVNAETEHERQLKATHAFSQELICRINFNIGVLNAMASAFPNASSALQQAVTTLQNDLSQIQNLGNATDVKNFAMGQYARDVESAKALTHTREIKDMSLSQRAILVQNYSQLKATYDDCEKIQYINISQERLNSYQVQLANFQNKSDKLAAKGFDTSSLNQLLQDAQNQIVVPLQNALGNATTAQQVQMAVRSYCLFDGCANGTNFHLEAKFEITRLNIVLADLQKNAAAFNLDSATLSQAQQYLTDAQTTLNSVGTAAYQKGQAQTIFSNIKNASKLIVQLMTQALKQPIGMPLK